MGTLSGSVTSSLTDYINTSGQVYVLVCAYSGYGCVRVCYAEISVTTS